MAIDLQYLKYEVLFAKDIPIGVFRELGIQPNSSKTGVTLAQNIDMNHQIFNKLMEEPFAQDDYQSFATKGINLENGPARSKSRGSSAGREGANPYIEKVTYNSNESVASKSSN